MDDQLQAFERSTGHQVLVYIDRTSGGVPIEDWAVRAFENWKVGRRGLDDGLVLFIMSEDRRLRIEVGYGLEATVTDIVASRIINEVIVPRIRDNDPDAAVREGVAAILEAIGGPAAEQKAEPRTRRPVPVGSPLQTFFIILVVIGFILLFITHPSLAIYLLFSMLSGGRRGGGGGGGFFGGGGRSGGGGASGSW